MARNKKFRLLILVLILIALPLLVLAIKQSTQTRSNAAAADKLEAEGGTLGGNAVSKQDSLASGGSYVDLGLSQTNTPTPNPVSNNAIYGSGIAGDALNNTRIGADYFYRDDIRFRAEKSGNLSSFRPYIIWSTTKPGYSGGTGGTLKFELRTDDNTSSHRPSTTIIVTAIHSDPMSKGYFPLINFQTPPALIAGQLYHLTVTNTDPDPKTNYVSMDHTYVDLPTSPMQPRFNNLDWAELISHSNGPYELRTENTPILALYYADGFTQGYGYMEVWVGAPMQITDAKSVREKITVTGGNKNISELNIRLKKISGTDPLTYKIIKSDGSILEQGSIPATSISTSSHSWVRSVFPSQKQLLNGQTYFLTFSSPSSSIYEAYPIRQGSGYSFPATTYFSDGLAEYTADGTTWYGWQQWGVNNRKEQNLQFYFK